MPYLSDFYYVLDNLVDTRQAQTARTIEDSAGDNPEDTAKYNILKTTMEINEETAMEINVSPVMDINEETDMEINVSTVMDINEETVMEINKAIDMVNMEEVAQENIGDCWRDNQ